MNTDAALVAGLVLASIIVVLLSIVMYAVFKHSADEEADDSPPGDEESPDTIEALADLNTNVTAINQKLDPVLNSYNMLIGVDQT